MKSFKVSLKQKKVPSFRMAINCQVGKVDLEIEISNNMYSGCAL